MPSLADQMEMKNAKADSSAFAFFGVRLRTSLRSSFCCEQLEVLLTLIPIPPHAPHRVPYCLH